jgi:hypothetical protein
MKTRLLAVASLATLSAATSAALVAAAAPSTVMAYPACVRVAGHGTVPIETGLICAGSFAGVFCGTPTVTTPQEVITVTACVPDGVEQR